MSTRPSLLLHCQHSLGLGHLVRSLALAAALADEFRVVLVSGGALPDGIELPGSVEVVALPPLGMAADGTLTSGDGRSIERTQAIRRELLLGTFRRVRPSVVILELFPFGRKKLASELMPLLEAARQCVERPLLLCSLRDILVRDRRDQGAHDERASLLANRFLDAVLVHSDPLFARLGESFRPRTPLRVPVHYTGFVVPPGQAATEEPRHDSLVVSVGGGRVGESLLRTALEAQRLLWPSERLELIAIAGPYLPEEAWSRLQALAVAQPGVELRRSVPNLLAVLRGARASLSQCGYNTALDLLRARVPALVVPYAEGREDEQTRRARRLETLGAVRVLDSARLDAATLAGELRALLRSAPWPLELDLDGARASALLVSGLARERLAVAS